MNQEIKQFLKDLMFEIDDDCRRILRKLVRKLRDSTFSLLNYILYRI